VIFEVAFIITDSKYCPAAYIVIAAYTVIPVYSVILAKAEIQNGEMWYRVLPPLGERKLSVALCHCR